MPCLTDIAAEELKELRRAGVQPTDEEIVWLNDLARKVETPSLRLQVAAGESVTKNGVAFHPLTIQAAKWFEQVACKLFESQTMHVYCLAFAMANGRVSGAFDELNDFQSARAAVNRWALRLPISYHELQVILATVLAANDELYPIPPARAPEPSDFDLVAELTAGSGLPASYWLKQGTRLAFATLRAIYRQRAASMAGIDADSDSRDSYREAMWNLMNASKLIREAHAKRQQESKQDVQTSTEAANGKE